MKKTFKFVALALVMVSMFAMSSCKKTEKLIVGEWTVSEIKDIPDAEMDPEEVAMMKLVTFTFNDDNTMTLGVAGFFSMPGTYEIDDDILTISTVSDGESDVEKYLIKSISKKEMCWGDPEGQPGTIVLTKK